VIIDSKVDDATVERLADKIDRIIKKKPDLTHVEVLHALMQVTCGVLASINCRDCRQITINTFRSVFAVVLDRANKQAVDGPSHTATH
jgi:hypothetical protein